MSENEDNNDNTEQYGCFTTVRVEPLPGGLGVRGWARHVERLQRDTTALFGSAVVADEMAAALHRGVVASGLALPHLVRLAVETPELVVSVTTRAMTASAQPMWVQVVRHDRMRPEMKHTLTAPEFAVRDAAVAAGYDDAVLLGADGLLSEGTTWSLVLGRPDGSWVTPQAPVLPSVTLALVAEHVPITAEPVDLGALRDFDRAAALSSGRGVHPIGSIGSTTFSGSVDVLRQAYAATAIEPVPLPFFL